MSAFLHDAAGAALLVAVVLVVLAGAAAAIVRARVEDPDVRALASEYLPPLATWCLVASATSTTAHLWAGDTAQALGLPLIVAAGATLLLATAGESGAPEPVPHETPPRAPREPAPRSLWADR